MKAFAGPISAILLSLLATPACALPPAGASFGALVGQSEAPAPALPPSAMAERYFGADLAVTLAALGCSGGAAFAMGLSRRRRPAAVPARPAAKRDWEEAVLRELEADLIRFTLSLRRAA